VAELRERYPQLVDEMVGLMTRMAETDKEVDRVNSAAPYGDHPRLRSVELAARGVDCLTQPDISIPQELRLPNLHSSSGQLFAWPPPQPSFAIHLLHAMYPSNHAYAEPWAAATNDFAGPAGRGGLKGVNENRTRRDSGNDVNDPKWTLVSRPRARSPKG